MIASTIEDLIKMSLSDLVAMTDEQILTYLQDELKVCPPISKPSSSINSETKTFSGKGSHKVRSAFAEKVLFNKEVDEELASIIAKAKENMKKQQKL